MTAESIFCVIDVCIASLEFLLLCEDILSCGCPCCDEDMTAFEGVFLDFSTKAMKFGRRYLWSPQGGVNIPTTEYELCKERASCDRHKYCLEWYRREATRAMRDEAFWTRSMTVVRRETFLGNRRRTFDPPGIWAASGRSAVQYLHILYLTVQN